MRRIRCPHLASIIGFRNGHITKYFSKFDFLIDIMKWKVTQIKLFLVRAPFIIIYKIAELIKFTNFWMGYIWMGNIASTVHHRYKSHSQKPPHFSENRNSESQSQYFCQVDENKQMNNLPYFTNKPQNYRIYTLNPFATAGDNKIFKFASELMFLLDLNHNRISIRQNGTK